MSRFTSGCPLVALLTISAFVATSINAGQMCTGCTGIEGGDDCQHHTTCNDNEVCHMTLFTNQQGQMLHDYGCASPQACHHSVDSILVGRRADTARHDICSVCCNDTSLCNQHLACDNTATTPSNLPRECSELNLPTKKNGVYTIYPYGSQHVPVSVYCIFDSAGEWTVIQRRYNGSVNFYRNWEAYKEGFGSPYGEYWLGNDVIHQLTAHGNHHLRVTMSDFDGIEKYAQYAAFVVGDESSNYQLLVLNYAGTAGDSLSYHSGQMFSTFDRDNDVYNGSCAQRFKGAWWYDSCHSSNLNGQYLSGHHASYADGINWGQWRGHYYSLKTATMMILKY